MKAAHSSEKNGLAGGKHLKGALFGGVTLCSQQQTLTLAKQPSPQCSVALIGYLPNLKIDYIGSHASDQMTTELLVLCLVHCAPGAGGQIPVDTTLKGAAGTEPASLLSSSRGAGAM